MSLNVVNSVTLRPEEAIEFLQLVGEFASKAKAKKDAQHWEAYRTLFGNNQIVHFTSRGEKFAEIGPRGDIQALWQRVLGEKPGLQHFARTNACIQSAQQTIAIERADLSYSPAASASAPPFALVTAVRARPGQAEALEDLLRKLAEAIPKADDPTRLESYQVLVGELSSYYTVRPLDELADLDEQLPAPELLARAFGQAEGGLIWRSGSAAVEHGERSIVALVPELSNSQAG
jgi:hypothetical protein